MLTYAHVCSRVLTCAHVCSRVQASSALLMRQLDDYCWGGSFDWTGSDASKLDLACMLEPEIHKLLKALSSYGIRGKVTMSERGKKEATVLASLDFCSLVPVAGEGLNNIANKQMLLDAAIPCPQSQRRRSHAQTQASSNSLGMGLVSMSARLLLQATRLCWLTLCSRVCT